MGHPIIIITLARNQRGESGASEGNCNRSSRGTEGQGPSTMKADYPKWEIDFNQNFVRKETCTSTMRDSTVVGLASGSSTLPIPDIP